MRIFLKNWSLCHIELRLEEVEVFVFGMGNIKTFLINLMPQKRSCSNADANIAPFSDSKLNFLRVILNLYLKPTFKFLDALLEVRGVGHDICILLLVQGHLRQLIALN